MEVLDQLGPYCERTSATEVTACFVIAGQNDRATRPSDSTTMVAPAARCVLSTDMPKL